MWYLVVCVHGEVVAVCMSVCCCVRLFAVAGRLLLLFAWLVFDIVAVVVVVRGTCCVCGWCALTLLTLPVDSMSILNLRCDTGAGAERVGQRATLRNNGCHILVGNAHLMLHLICNW